MSAIRLGAQIILLCAAHNGPPRPAVLAVRRLGTVMHGPPPGRCWPAGVAVQACCADRLGCVEARRVWVKWRVGACSFSPESASAPSPASPTTVSWRGSGCPAPSPNSLRAGFKAGPVPAVAPALADGWSYWSARPLSTLRPGFADIHACDQAAAEHVGMEDYSLGEHGAI